MVKNIPGFSHIQDTHFSSSALLYKQHSGHCQDLTGLLNFFLKAPVVTVQPEDEEAMVAALSEATGNVRTRLIPVADFSVSLAAHFITSSWFCTKQVSQSRVPTTGLNLSRKPVSSAQRVALPLPLGVLIPICWAEVFGGNFLAWQAMHLLSVTLFGSRQMSHCHGDLAFKLSESLIPPGEKLLIAGLVYTTASVVVGWAARESVFGDVKPTVGGKRSEKNKVGKAFLSKH